VPQRYREMILNSSKRHGVSAALLAAQIRAESDFQAGSVSSAGAQGISQLMPYESVRFHADPFNPKEAIDAQARLMRELLARFAAVPLALAAYNAGPNAVARCGCVPPYPETQSYVRRILGWLREGGGQVVRLVA
jgi:soluble lytic murein transglycosylase-like protein